MKSIGLFFLYFQLIAAYATAQVDGLTILPLVLEKTIDGRAERINFSPFSEGLLQDSLQNRGFQTILSDGLPLVSREVLEYSVVSTSGRMSMLSGFVHLEAGADGSLNFTSDKGAAVVLKTEVNAVSWIFDRGKALNTAKGSRYVLFVEVKCEEVTAQLSGSKKFGGQRSFMISSNAIAVDVSTSKVVASHTGSVPRMSSVQSQAVQDGMQVILGPLMEKLNNKIGRKA